MSKHRIHTIEPEPLVLAFYSDMIDPTSANLIYARHGMPPMKTTDTVLKKEFLLDLYHKKAEKILCFFTLIEL